MYRVMQIIETGESFNAFEGSEDECWTWIDDNEDQYPESSFYVEIIAPIQNY